MLVKHTWFDRITWLSDTVDLVGCGRTSLALVPTYPHTVSISYDSSSASCEAGTKHIKFAWLEGTTWSRRRVYNPPEWNPDARSSSLALAPTSPYTYLLPTCTHMLGLFFNKIPSSGNCSPISTLKSFFSVHLCVFSAYLCVTANCAGVSIEVRFG